jgi:glycosyltransferase involved in cell wall biosynthesis
MPAIEAMAAGCVPIVSNVGGISEIVVNGKTRIVLPLATSLGPFSTSPPARMVLDMTQFVQEALVGTP